MSPRNVIAAQEPEASTRAGSEPTNGPVGPAGPPEPTPPTAGALDQPAGELGQDLKALGRDALERAEQAPDVAAVPAPAPHTDDDPTEAEADSGFGLGRVAWLVTVLSCLLAVTILVFDGYLGYAGVTLAVALAAAINLL